MRLWVRHMPACCAALLHDCTHSSTDGEQGQGGPQRALRQGRGISISQWGLCDSQTKVGRRTEDFCFLPAMSLNSGEWRLMAADQDEREYRGHTGRRRYFISVGFEFSSNKWICIRNLLYHLDQSQKMPPAARRHSCGTSHNDWCF